jgi:ribonucleoside-diphosphate reductase alpha chain
MQAYDACRLIALNLFSFVRNPFTSEASIDYDLLYKIAYEQMRLADNLIDLELEKINAILDKIDADPETEDVKRREKELWSNIKRVASSGRRAGCGFTALGDMLAALGLKYDSDEALEVVGEVMSTKMRGELDCTIDLAVLHGTFDGWDANEEWTHTHHAEFPIEGNNDFYSALLVNFPEQAERMMKYGRRNVSWSTVAPTGSLSILKQVTSGLEPLFAAFYLRRKKVNPGEDGVRVDFTDGNGDNWTEFPVLHGKFKLWVEMQIENGGQIAVARHGDRPPNLEDIDINDKMHLDLLFGNSPWYKSTAPDIDWIKRVKMQTIIQQYTTHSISSTINLPEEVTVAEVSEIYEESWGMGLKGVTVYRDGSRSGVLVTNNEKKESFEYKDAPKRPKDLPVEVHTTVSGGIKWNVFVGLFDGRPYEVFATPHLTNKVNFTLHKAKRGTYNLLEDGEVYAEDIMAEMGDMQDVVTRLISTSLRHGADIKFIVEQLNKTSGDITSFSKAIARVLKKYIPDGISARVTCNECQSENVIFEEGCNKCLDCGNSKCG